MATGEWEKDKKEKILVIYIVNSVLKNSWFWDGELIFNEWNKTNMIHYTDFLWRITSILSCAKITIDKNYIKSPFFLVRAKFLFIS